MKISLWITLVSLFAVACGATLKAPVNMHEPVLSKETEPDALGKAGRTLETVGRLLQGENAAMSEDQHEDVIKALRFASNSGEVSSEDGKEYIWPKIIRAVIQGSVAHVVQKKLNKG